MTLPLYKATERYKYNLPNFVISSDDKKRPAMDDRYQPKESALSKPYLVANNPKYNHYVIFDVDTSNSLTLWDSVGIPSPTLIVQNKENYHSHYYYELETPLPAKSKRSTPTQKLLEAVILYYKYALMSHHAVVEQMQLSKNAVSDSWETYGASDNCGIYTLSELAEYTKPIPKKPELPKDVSCEGRNDYLFNCGRYYAYSIVKDCESEGDLFGMIWVYLNQLNNNEINDIFTQKTSLSTGEVREITKSISTWVWDKRLKFCLLKPSNRNLGALGLDKMGSGWNYQDSKVEVKRRKSLGAEYTNKVRKEKTEHAIWLGIKMCQDQGIEITKLNVSKLSGVSLKTVYRHSDLLNQF
jgi:hypothetical protein